MCVVKLVAFVWTRVQLPPLPPKKFVIVIKFKERMTMEIFQVLLNILAIIGIIIVAALIIYFLAVLVLSIINKSSGKSEGEANSNFGRPKVLQSNELGDDFTWEDAQKGRWDDSKKEQENKEVVSAEPMEQRSSVLDEDVDSLDAERRKRIEEKRNMSQDFDDFDSIFDDEEEDTKVEEPVEETNEEELNKLIDVINAESVAQFKSESEKSNEVMAEQIEDTTVNVFDDSEIEEVEDVEEEEAVEAEPKSDEEIEREREEIARQKAELEEQRKLLAEERQKFEEYKQEVATIEQQSVSNTGSMYDNWDANALYQRLEVLKERLKVNEKDLKANRKEYKPLEKVKRRLDKDKEKLRRKEAVVARKKVILYGVNNYVDIDEDKAKKLSEDLDLLDALRMSVQHCEDVMKENKDRFPILEKTNKILTLNNQNIKDDIAEIENAIAKLNGENNEVEGENAAE